MEVFPCSVFRLLSVSELVVQAVLHDQPVERGRHQAKLDAHRQLQQHEEKLLRHSIAVDVSVKSQSAMQVVMELVRVLVDPGQVGSAVLGVEELQPVSTAGGEPAGDPQGELQLPVQEPQQDGDGDLGIHHVEEEDQGVRLGVEESPHGVDQSLPGTELPGRGEVVAVEAAQLVVHKEQRYEGRSYGDIGDGLESGEDGEDGTREPSGEERGEAVQETEDDVV